MLDVGYHHITTTTTKPKSSFEVVVGPCSALFSCRWPCVLAAVAVACVLKGGVLARQDALWLVQAGLCAFVGNSAAEPQAPT